MPAILLAQNEGFILFVVIPIVAVFLGEGVVRSTQAMQRRRRGLQYACGIIGVLIAAFWIWVFSQDRGELDAGAFISGACVGFFLGLGAYFPLALLAFVYIHVLSPPFRWLADRQRSSANHREQEQRRQRDREWQRESEQQRSIEEQRRREAEANTNKQQLSDRRRRDDARAKCELAFTLYAPELGQRFTRSMFDDFLKRYMGDDRMPEEVEERARQLEGILAEHRTALRPAMRFKNIEELATWYVAEKKRIENLPVDEMFREQHLVQLHTMYADLTQQIMEQRP